MKAEMTILAKCEPTKSKDGANTYYKLTVLQGQDAGQISCPESVYVSVKEGMKAVFNIEYNSEYKSLKILGVAPETLNGSSAGKATSSNANNGGH